MVVLGNDDGDWVDDPVFEDTRDAALELARMQWPDREHDFIIYECVPK